jgi:hypothetical protein
MTGATENVPPAAVMLGRVWLGFDEASQDGLIRFRPNLLRVRSANPFRSYRARLAASVAAKMED